MNRSTVGAVVVALMLASGIAGYLAGRPNDFLDRTPVTASTAKPAAPAKTATPAALPTPAAAPNEAFAYRRTGIDSSKAEGEACLFFNKPLATGDAIKYDDYVQVSPDVKSAWRAVDDKLCASGFGYGQDYTVTLRAGLPSKDGGKLTEDRKVSVALGARPAAITLPAKGFILPRDTAAGLPITTLNISQLGISVYRVNERGLDRFTENYDSSFPGNGASTESWTLRQWLSGDKGKRIWRGTMDVRNVLNQPVTTAFPIRETIKDWKPGAYFVVAWNTANAPAKDGEDEDDTQTGNVAGMWVMDTDIALTTFSGRDGLSVYARSLASAQPLRDLEVVLLSRGNEPIAKAVTSAEGRVTFPAGLTRSRGAAAATSIMALDTKSQEFSRLELTKSAFDLSDRGVEGRALPGPVDAFLYTERGVYRPGETVQLMAMMRDDGATALKDMPVTLIVKRPDGSEFTRYTLALQSSGGLHQAIALPKSSRHGMWSVAAHIDPKAASVGQVEFAVQDFIPEKLKIELSSDQTVLRTGKPNGFSVSADFLYGAPAADLKVESDLRITVDPTPFPAFGKYSFGLEAERKKFEPPLITLDGSDTDEKGKSRLEWAGDKVADTALPLVAHINARVFEPGNGRATQTDKSLPVRTREVYLGIRPAFDGRYAREGVETSFDVVAVDAEGKQVERPTVTYTIERLNNEYQWYQVDGRWRWQALSTKRLVTADTVALKADAPTRLSRQLTWGSYRLTTIDRAANTSTSTTFYVGWYGGSSDAEEAPDTLKVASDKQNYAPGDTARLRIEAPFTGEALIAIATDRIVATYTTKVVPGGTTLDIPMKAEWGAGAYALVTAWRPLSAPAERTPVRTIGATWLGLDPGLRTLAVQIAAPEKVTPRQRIDVSLRVANATGPDAYVTLAAVDEGILQLTKYRTPDPATFYFGKRQLGVEMRDDYGRLLDIHADELGRIRTGGDGGSIGGLDIVPDHIVSLFSGPVKLDEKGEARISLDIPDFIGQLRLMAVAYDKTKVGAAEARLFVRDAVTADVILPRFLSPGDQGRVALSLHNVEGQPGDYRVALEATGAVSLERPVDEAQQLALNQRKLSTWTLRGGDVGIGNVAVTVSGPGNFKVRRDWNIQVRSAQTPSAVDTVSQLDPSRELTVDREVISQFSAGTTQVSVSLSRTPGIDVAALLRALDKYPHGCIEQTTSRALPLLYYNDVALLGYGPSDPKIADRVQEAIYRIADMQTSDGSFGMWGPTSSPAAEWLQPYALDFLLRARDQQMAVPAASLQRALTWLNRTVDKMSPSAQAYGWYVLAKAGLADAGRVRYFQDTAASKIKGGLAWAQLAAALNQAGEPGRARLAFSVAQMQIGQRDPNDYYGSSLRDNAALLAIAQEAGGREGLVAVVGSVRGSMSGRPDETTTQEQAWLVLAAHAFQSSGELTYSVDGEARKATTEPVVINPDAAALTKGLHVKNEGDKPVWLQVTARGVPKEPLPAASNRLSIYRQYFTFAGEKVDLANVRQTDRFVVSLSGDSLQGGYHQVALLDLLPAGFEIEAVINDETAKSFPFLRQLTPTKMAEARDDRFFASFDLGNRPYRNWWDDETKNGDSFQVAYIVRAVTPGRFALPAAQVSDMYAPRIYGRTAMGAVTIAPR